MTAADWDWDDEPAYFEDYWDDEPAFVKEEPDCYACNDSGFIYPDGKRCRSCQPTWLRHWWWRLTWRITNRLAWRRVRRNHPGLYDDEAPF